MDARGDDEFGEFMHECGHRLYRVAYLLAGDRGRAEDLTQEALARTYTVWHRVRRDDAYVYARRVLTNLYNDWWRRRSWRERIVERVPDRTAPGDQAAASADRDQMVRALRALTRRERSLIVCRYYLDMSIDQTALELGISTGAVKSLTSRALGKLRISPALAAASWRADPGSADARPADPGGTEKTGRSDKTRTAIVREECA